jgi:hypothetical protein
MCVELGKMPLLKCLGDVDEWIGLFLPSSMPFSYSDKRIKKDSTVYRVWKPDIGLPRPVPGSCILGLPTGLTHYVSMRPYRQEGENEASFFTGKSKDIFIDKNWKQAFF